MQIIFPAQKLDNREWHKGAIWCVHWVSLEAAQQWQRPAVPDGDQHYSPWWREACLSPGEEHEVQEAVAYGLLFWIFPTNLYSKPAISAVAMETKVPEYNETHVWMPLPPLSVHHSAFLDSKGKKKDICVITVRLWPLKSRSGWIGIRLQWLFCSDQGVGWLLGCKGSVKEDNLVHSRGKNKEWMGRNVPLWAVWKREKSASFLSPFTLLVISMPIKVCFLMVFQSVNYRSQWSHLTWSDRQKICSCQSIFLWKKCLEASEGLSFNVQHKAVKNCKLGGSSCKKFLKPPYFL